MAKRITARLWLFSLQNKIFFSTTLVILLISVVIALFTRWVLISSLTSALELRGMGIAQSVAEASRGHILTHDIPQLTNLVFDARLGERKSLIYYVYILDKQEKILAHSFTRQFPMDLAHPNQIESGESHNIRLLHIEGIAVYHIAVPVLEGIYHIGSVHVGLYKKHIDQLIAKLRTTFLGFVSAVIVIFFIISHWLSKYITQPITQLTRVSDELSRGDLNDNLDFANGSSKRPEFDHAGATKDEVKQLADSFFKMTRHIKDSQAKLRESEEKYRSLFASGPNPIFVLDRHSLEIVDANPIAEDVYGYAKTELRGMRFSDLGPFADSHSRTDDSDGGVIIRPKCQFFKKDNTPIYVNVYACPARYAQKDALIVATPDITAMVEKDNQLIQFGKLKNLGEMSAGIAHELNQPLNAIKMGSEYLEMILENGREVPADQLQNVVTEVSRQVDRAAAIINRLRDFGRKSDFSRERVDLNQPIKSVLEILGRQFTLQNISVDLELQESLPPVLAHPNRLEQVFFNLLTNARDALIQQTESGGHAFDRSIKIQTTAQAGRVSVSVADNGIGIPDTVKNQIFEAFFTTKEMGEGMGLGLSITNGIVEDYGGQIDVISREGKGTDFILIFPEADGPGGDAHHDGTIV
jgi:PAS domain S-box-containing protein